MILKILAFITIAAAAFLVGGLAYKKHRGVKASPEFSDILAIDCVALIFLAIVLGLGVLVYL